MQCRGARGPDAQREAGAGIGLHRRPGTIHRQLQHRRRPGQARPPPGERALQAFPLQLLQLLLGEVGVLQGELRQRRGPAGGEGLVQHRHLAQEEGVRPAVRDDVVETDQQGVRRGAAAQEDGAHQRPARQVHRGARRLEGQPLLLHRGAGRRQGREVDQRQRPGDRRRRDDLVRDAVLLAEGGAQRLVAAGDLGEGAGERRHLQRTVQLGRGADVVKRISRFQAVEHPEAALGEGEAGPFAAGGGRARRRLQVIGGEPSLPQLLCQLKPLLRGQQAHEASSPASTSSTASAIGATSTPVAAPSSSSRTASSSSVGASKRVRSGTSSGKRSSI